MTDQSRTLETRSSASAGTLKVASVAGHGHTLASGCHHSAEAHTLLESCSFHCDGVQVDKTCSRSVVVIALDFKG
jgi:hypothetical protein